MTYTQGPIDVPENASLWRYVPLHTFFLHLQGKVYLPTIATLQECDRREGAQVFDHIVATEGFTHGELEKLREWVRNRKLSKSERDCFDANQGFSGANQRVYFKHYYATLQRSRFAWCWFKSEHESAAMWSFYGNKGVAIRTRLNLLQEALAPCQLEWRVSGMRYIDFRKLNRETFLNSSDCKDWVRRPFLLKGVEYRLESEVRLITVAEERSRGLELEGVAPEKWMEQVLFWPSMPASCVEAVKAAVEKLRPGLKGRLAESQLHSFGRNVEEPSDSEAAWSDSTDCIADEEIPHWPEFMKIP